MFCFKQIRDQIYSFQQGETKHTVVTQKTRVLMLMKQHIKLLNYHDEDY